MLRIPGTDTAGSRILRLSFFEVAHRTAIKRLSAARKVFAGSSSRGVGEAAADDDTSHANNDKA